MKNIAKLEDQRDLGVKIELKLPINTFGKMSVNVTIIHPH